MPLTTITANGVTDLRHSLPGIDPFRQESQPRREPQDQCEEVGEFLQKSQDRRFAANFFNSIRTVLKQPALGFARRQPLRTAIEARYDIVSAKHLNLH